KDELAEAGRAENESYIEQLLLAEVARIDPKFALSKAEEMLDRRAYSLAPGQNASSPKLDQQNARDLLVNLRPLLPQIEQHLPERYQALRQKMNELKNAHPGFDRLTYLTQDGAANNLLTAASTAPPAVRDRLYQQAAFKAIDEGNLDSARQIANDKLDSEMRAAVFGRIAAQEQVRKDKTVQLEELRQTLVPPRPCKDSGAVYRRAPCAARTQTAASLSPPAPRDRSRARPCRPQASSLRSRLIFHY